MEYIFGRDERTGCETVRTKGAEHSPKFNTVKAYYDAKRWTRAMMLNAVGKWITEAEAEEILNAEEVT